MEMKSNSDGLRHADNSAKTKEGAKENPPGTIKHEVETVFFSYLFPGCRLFEQRLFGT